MLNHQLAGSLLIAALNGVEVNASRQLTHVKGEAVFSALTIEGFRDHTLTDHVYQGEINLIIVAQCHGNARRHICRIRRNLAKFHSTFQ